MDHTPIDPHAVADAMLARGFAELLAPEALDDSAAISPPPGEDYSACSKPESASEPSPKFTPARRSPLASPIQVITAG